MKHRIGMSVVLILMAAQALAQTPVRKERVYVRDIAGIWINDAYLKELNATKSPHAAAKKAPPVVIAIKREGQRYPIVTTNFDKATLQVVISLEPDDKPNSYRLVLAEDDRPISSTEVKNLPFEGVKNPQGKFDRLKFSEPRFMKGRAVDYLPIEGEISPHVNRVVLAGKYLDDKGRAWSFADSGEAIWPEQTMNYEISLNHPGASCEYFQAEDGKSGEKKPYGFSWKGGKLSVFPARMENKQVRCEAKPLAVLTPQ
jgi:hypothetical protein